MLGGVDTLVFTAGIGENAASIRSRICEGLEFLGIELDETNNQAHASIISKDSTHTVVRIIPTDEQLMIAKSIYQMLF